MMISIIEGLYVVQMSEMGVYQDIDPATGQPFASEAAAKAWADAFIQAHAAAAMGSSTPSADQLARAKTDQTARIRLDFEAQVAALKADCAPYEVETWPVQTQEYSRWLADKSSLVPYVSALATGRGMALDALMAKIGIKVAGLAELQGKQQALEDRIKAAETLEAVAAVTT